MREAECTIATASGRGRDGFFVAEMGSERAGEARFRGGEGDDGVETGDIGLFPSFNLGVDCFDDLCFLVFTPGEVPKDAEAMNNTARSEFYTAAVVPFL